MLKLRFVGEWDVEVEHGVVDEEENYDFICEGSSSDDVDVCFDTDIRDKLVHELKEKFSNGSFHIYFEGNVVYDITSWGETDFSAELTYSNIVRIN
jgi:hypothetical protein